MFIVRQGKVEKITYLATVLALVRVHNRGGYYLKGRLLNTVLFRPLCVFQSGPGGTIFDLHDPRLRVASPFREKRHGVPFGECLKGPREELLTIMRFAVDGNIARRR